MAHASRCFSEPELTSFLETGANAVAPRKSFLSRSPGPPRRAQRPAPAARAPPSPNFAGYVSGGQQGGERGSPLAALPPGSPRPAAGILRPGRAAEAEGWGGRLGSGKGSQRRSFCLLFPSPRFGKVLLLGKPLSSSCWRVSDWLAATGPRRPQQDSPLGHRSSGSCQTPVVAASGWGLY